MNPQYGRYAIPAGAALTVFVLQLSAVYLNWNFDNHIKNSFYGMQTFSIALLAVVLGVAGGIILALLFFEKNQNDSRNDGLLLKAVILGTPSAFAVILKLGFGALGTGALPFSPLRPFWSELWEWSIHSQVPSFWLGLVIGWLAKQLFVVRRGQ